MVSTLSNTYKKPITWPYLIIVLTALWYQLLEPKSLIDTSEYWHAVKYYWQVETLKIDVWNTDRWMLPARRTPLYPFVLNILHIPGVAVFQTLIALVVPAILEKYILRVKQQTQQRLLWFWWTLSPLQYFYAALPMPEILAQAFLLWWLWALLRRQLAPASLSLSLLILLKPIFVVLMVPFLALALISWSGNIHKSTMLWTLVPFLTVALLWNHHAKNWDFHGVSSVGQTNSYEYNRYMLLKQKFGIAYADSLYQKESAFLHTMHQLDPQKGKWMQDKVIQSILEYPLTYAFIHLKGCLQLFLDPGRYDAMVFLDWNRNQGFMQVKDGNQKVTVTQRPWYEWLYMGVFFLINAAKFTLILWILWLTFRNFNSIDWSQKLIWLSVIMYVVVIGPVGSARYLVPLFPLLIYSVVNGFPSKNKNESFTIK